LGKLLIAIFDAVLIWFVWMAISYGEFVVASLTLVILITFNVIFLKESAYPFRYMFPGLICFFLFLVLPIIFTIYVAFTNLGTGHLLSDVDVKNILLNERSLGEGSELYKADIGESKGQKYIILKLLESESVVALVPFFFDRKMVIDATVIPNNDVEKFLLDNQISLLPKGEIFKLGESLRNIEIKLPDSTVLTSNGRATYAKFLSRFVNDENGNLKEVSSGEVFFPNYQTGFFASKTEQLSPGFRTTVGFSNFWRLFKDTKIAKPFAKVFTWTFVWALCTVCLTFVSGLFLAITINNKGMRFKPLYRILLIVPYSIPFFISVLIFKGLLNKDFGIVNQLVAPLIGGTNVPWLEHPTFAKISCLLVNLWLGFPYMLLVLTGILQAIPEDIYEAARLDGASKWITLKKITMPYVMSAVGPLLVGSFAFNFNNFVGIYLLTGGLPPMDNVTTPAGETDILISYTYRLAFEGGQGQDFGLASAIAILIFIIIAIITLLNFKFSGVFDNEVKK